MFCPVCGAEYREGFTRCRDCEVDLVEEEPGAQPPRARPSFDVSEARLVVVASFTGEFEARVAEGALEASGVRAMVRKDDEGGMSPPLSFSRGVELVVREEDVGVAREILAQVRERGGRGS